MEEAYSLKGKAAFVNIRSFLNSCPRDDVSLLGSEQEHCKSLRGPQATCITYSWLSSEVWWASPKGTCGSQMELCIYQGLLCLA